MEYAKNVLKLSDAESNEEVLVFFSSLISIMSCSLIGGRQEIQIQKGSMTHDIYKKTCITERFNCNYNLNEQYRDTLNSSGLQLVGASKDGDVRIVELSHHTFFLAMLFQPQLTSTTMDPHPVILKFLRAAIN